MVAFLPDDARPLKFRMDSKTQLSDKSYGNKVRAQMETENLGSIIARFTRAVTWEK